MTSESSKTDAFKEITIVLADDHQVVRQGLRAMLEAEHDLRVIGEAGTGLEAARLVERLRPNVLARSPERPRTVGRPGARNAASPAAGGDLSIGRSPSG